MSTSSSGCTNCVAKYFSTSKHLFRAGSNAVQTEHFLGPAFVFVPFEVNRCIF